MTQRSKKKKSKKAPNLDIDRGSHDGPSRDFAPEAPPEVAARPGYFSHILILFILFAAYYLRSTSLDIKPPHYDEGINGHFVAKMWRDGYYHYDPTNFHGPLYFYFLQFAEVLFGRGVVGFRWITGLMSLAGIGLIVGLRRYLGSSVVWAALVMTVSAGSVFYARYSIHENLFIFFQIFFVYAYFAWQDTKSRLSVTLMVISFVGTFSTKETFFIFYGTWFIAVAVVRIYEKIRGVAHGKSKQQGLHEPLGSFWQTPASGNDWVIISGLGFLFLVLLYTGFLLNPAGYRDMLSSLVTWTQTGTAKKSGQEKDFIYWLDLMRVYEWPSLVGLVFSLPLFFVVDRRKKILVLVAFGTWLAYSLIPYKTPWLIVNFIWPFALVFGFALESLSRLKSKRLVYGARILALALVGVSLEKTIQLNFKEFANPKEPYVYVQSTEQMKRVIDQINERVVKRPEDLNMRLMVLVKDTWPLPWVFSLFPNLSFGTPENIELTGAHVILIDGSKRPNLEGRLRGRFFREPFQIRDSYENGYAYLDFDKFKEIVPAGTEIFEGSTK